MKKMIRRIPVENRRRTNFTLIELLIVVAIIAILAGMLLPALRAAMEKGRKASCTGNMKQVTLGGLLYANDHNDFLSRVYGQMFIDKDQLLYGYINSGKKGDMTKKNNFKIFECPSFDRNRRVLKWIADKNESKPINGYITYSATTVVDCNNADASTAYSQTQKPGGWALCRWRNAATCSGGYHKISQTNPRTVLLTEIVPMRQRSNLVVTLDCLHTPAYANDLQMYVYSVDWERHNMVANFGMLDGSVRSYKYGTSFYDSARRRYTWAPQK